MGYSDGYIVFDNDMNSLLDALKGNGVISGVVVSAQGTPDMTVAVASGVVVANSTYVTISATNKNIVASDPSNPRKDIISINSSGTITVTSGAPAAANPSASSGPYTSVPIPPNIPSNEIIIGEVWVGSGVSAITSTAITDRRAILLPVNDTPVNGAVAVPISSNWAYDHKRLFFILSS